MKNRPHLINGEFQSDKYPTTPRGCVPLKTSDPTAMDLLWEYAQRRRAVDAEFADDLEEALRIKGYASPTVRRAKVVCFDTTTSDGMLLLEDAGTEIRFHSTSFVSDRPTRFPRIGEDVEVVFDVEGRILRVRSSSIQET